MKTSYFGLTPANTPGAIAISLYPPKRSKYLHYPVLAPSNEILRAYKSPSALAIYGQIGLERSYTFKYFDQLFELDPREVWNKLHELVGGVEPILLCYEKPGQFCHRHLVAKWFKHALGEVVSELGGVR